MFLASLTHHHSRDARFESARLRRGSAAYNNPPSTPRRCRAAGPPQRADAGHAREHPCLSASVLWARSPSVVGDAGLRGLGCECSLIPLTPEGGRGYTQRTTRTLVAGRLLPPFGGGGGLPWGAGIASIMPPTVRTSHTGRPRSFRARTGGFEQQSWRDRARAP